MVQPATTIVDVDGVQLTVYCWNEHSRAHLPTIVLTHATGFHGRCWDQVVARLGDYPVVAMDMRGHGHSQAGDFSSWHVFADDLSQVLQRLDVREALGVGHSMGAYCTLEAACNQARLFSRLLLIDPVIFSPQQYQQWDPQVLYGESRHFTARRQSVFDSAADFRQRYGGRPPYSNFHPEVFEDYCRFGIHQLSGSDSVELACSPLFEARIYDCAASNGDILEKMQALKIPVSVVRAMQAPADFSGFDFRYSPTWPHLAGKLQRGEDIYLGDQTHFLPLESPELAARLILQQLK